MKWRWLLSEYLLKGLYLGLACQAAISVQSIRDVAVVVSGSLAVPLLVVVAALIRRPSRVSARGDSFAKIILALIDHPFLIHVGIPIGVVTSFVYLGWSIPHTLLAATIGLLIGGGIYALVALRKRVLRRGAMTIALLAILGLVILAVSTGRFAPSGSGGIVALSLACSALVLYLLTFSGRSEETELDIGMICLLLSLALGSVDTAPTIRSIVLLGPVGLYVVYCERIRKQFVVFKHIVRAMDQERRGNWRDALIAYRLALKSDPKSELATAGSWRVHRQIDPHQIVGQDDLISLIDPDACLVRATALIQSNQPSKEHLSEAQQLLEIVDRREPNRHWTIELRRIDALLAENRVEEARLRAKAVSMVDPRSLPELPAIEVESLFQLWTNLLRRPELLSVGTALLQDEHAVFDVIAVVEERLSREPKDTMARDFTPFLYRKVDRTAFDRFSQRWGGEAFARFNFRFCRDVAMELSNESPMQAVELLWIAREGLADEQLSLLYRIAQLKQSHDPTQALTLYRQVREEARAKGLSSLSRTDREALDESLKRLALDAEEKGNTSEAITNWEVFATSDRSGVNTRRRLQSLYESMGDRLNAVRHLQAALAYDLPEKEAKTLRAEKTALYAAISPEELRPRLTEVERFFDFDFCYRRAFELFEAKGGDEEVIHFIDLAELGGTKLLRLVNFLLGRLHLRRGDDRAAALCFEQTASDPPKQFRNDEEKKAYFRACRTLGELYVERLGEPEKGIKYLSIFKDNAESGADTLYLLAKAYEGAGQMKAARKWYDMVLVYPSHPRAASAKEALSRLAAKQER
ncbi:hypothetical protein K2Y11_13090 [bacterium]|nr:hypothetical protein [bacterium]